MPKQPPLPETEYELEIVLMSGEVILRRFPSRQSAMEDGYLRYQNGLWVAGKGSEVVFTPGHRIRKMAIREKKPLSL